MSPRATLACWFPQVVWCSTATQQVGWSQETCFSRLLPWRGTCWWLWGKNSRIPRTVTWCLLFFVFIFYFYFGDECASPKALSNVMLFFLAGRAGLFCAIFALGRNVRSSFVHIKCVDIVFFFFFWSRGARDHAEGIFVSANNKCVCLSTRQISLNLLLSRRQRPQVLLLMTAVSQVPRENK